MGLRVREHAYEGDRRRAAGQCHETPLHHPLSETAARDDPNRGWNTPVPSGVFRSMVDVDLVQCWKIGKGVFTLWQLPLAFIAKFTVLGLSTGMSVRRSLVSDAFMTVTEEAVSICVPLPVLT